MIKTTADILSIISSKGGVIIPNTRLTFDLITIARAAKKNEVRVIIKGERTTQEMMLIAREGGGFVTFELNP